MKKLLISICLLCTLPCMAFEIDPSRNDQAYLEQEYRAVIEEACACVDGGKCSNNIVDNLTTLTYRDYSYLNMVTQDARYDIIGIYRLIFYLRKLPEIIDVEYGMVLEDDNEMGCSTRTDNIIDYLSKTNDTLQLISYLPRITQYIKDLGYFSDYRIVDLYAHVLTQLSIRKDSTLRGQLFRDVVRVKSLNNGRAKAKYRIQ